jgi:membrane protein implicated in regulation of membrane protease activity
VVDLSSFFLVVFIVSLGLTLITFALGSGGLHLPGVHHGGAHVDLHVHGGHVLHGGHDMHIAHPDGHPAGQGRGDAGDSLSPFNMATILAFLTWFGGAGYVLTGYFSVLAALAVALAAVVGFAGAGIVFLFLTRVLLPGQTPYLAGEDFDLTGTVGRLSAGIRAGGTGEMVYSKAGTRRVASARSEDGQPIDRGAEVVIVRAERGVAYVQTFEEFMQGEVQASPEAP